MLMLGQLKGGEVRAGWQRSELRRREHGSSFTDIGAIIVNGEDG